nr:unnamed protein product [Callosobruchus analis]
MFGLRRLAGSLQLQRRLSTALPYDLHRLDTAPAVKVELTKEDAVALYKNMHLIRKMEHTIGKLYQSKKIRGFCHLYTGVARGKGGSMHLYARNFYGGQAIVGAQIPLGTGIALAHKYKGDGGINFAIMGDAATNQGQVFESYNIAKLLSLPIVFLVRIICMAWVRITIEVQQTQTTTPEVIQFLEFEWMVWTSWLSEKLLGMRLNTSRAAKVQCYWK